jgi:hypothetical protein
MESGIGFRLYGCQDLAVDFYQGLAGKRGVADAQAVVSLSGLSVWHWLPAAVRGSGNPCTSVMHWLPAAVRGSGNPCTSVCVARMRGGVIKKLNLRLREAGAQQLF